jgi:hypothetical protein
MFEHRYWAMAPSGMVPAARLASSICRSFVMRRRRKRSAQRIRGTRREPKYRKVPRKAHGLQAPRPEHRTTLHLHRIEEKKP